MNIKEIIVNESKKIGLDVLGFTSCEPFKEIEKILRYRRGNGYLSGFEESDIEKRINPSLYMENCRTIISAGMSYYTDKRLIKCKENYIHKCSVSMSSWGIDYHIVLGKMLEKLAAFIRENYNSDARVFVDANPLPEREIARRAGIGFIGKNGFLINKEFGSFIFLGEILTSLPIEPDFPVEDECGDCDLCIRSCPSNAIVSPYTLNAKICISYLTQCKDLPSGEYIKLGNSIYGCDICQLVCPKNRNIKFCRQKEFIPESWNSYPDAIDILNMDNKTYDNTFKKTSSGWRGRRTLQRNAIIALGNSKNKNVSEYLVRMLSDQRKEIRKASVYSLYNLLKEESFPILKEHTKRESDVEIINIIESLGTK